MLSFLKARTEADADLWQDREIRFDTEPSCLECRPGEIVIDSVNSVEDTKGNNGERGSIAITNLRIVWQSHRVTHTNLSIGYAVIQNLTIRSTQSRLRGTAQALFIMTKFNGSRFEFIFTSLVKASPRLFTTVQAVFRSYETSKLYRDLKLRGAVVRDKELVQLPHEKVFSKVPGVMNLSAEQGNLGVFIITNIRVVWFAVLAENFNVSIPYIQMTSVCVRGSKFGKALVIETSERAGGYLLGFRVDPPEGLETVVKEITALRSAALVAPLFGIDFTVEEKPESLEALTVPHASDDVEVVATGEAVADAFAAYFADGSKEVDRPVIFSTELGLAVEAPPEGLTIEKLWSAI